jgi:hypothetical protein
MMVVLLDHLTNESAEWLDVDEMDLDHQGQQQTPNATAMMPVIDIYTAVGSYPLRGCIVLRPNILDYVKESN